MGGWGMTGRSQQLCWLGCFGAVVGVLLAARAVPGPPPTSGGATDCTCGNGPPDLSTEGPGRPGWATAGLAGNVSECCCSFNDLERTNAELVLPLLARVVATDFFAHFRVDLCTDCRLWHDTPLCVLRDCGVCECDNPPHWAASDGAPGSIAMPETAAKPGDTTLDCGQPEMHIDDKVALTAAKHIRDGWHVTHPRDSLPASGDTGAPTVVVDLRLNPERHTGYAGESAAMVWKAIHESNCFQGLDPDGGGGGVGKMKMPHSYMVGKLGVDPRCLLPVEQRVYNRLISGMHTSISLHIAKHFCHQLSDVPGECESWAEAPTIAADRVLSHPDRLENLYVAFAVMLRAVVRAGPAITAAVPADDPAFADGLAEWRDTLLPEIRRLAGACPRTFDETSLLQAGNTDALIQRLDHLHEIMRCVGCDRCKLWGTLQALGVSTGLRVLMAAEGEPISLDRQGAVALVHTLERFSKSLDYARGFGQA